MNLFDAISTSNDLVTGHIASNIFSVLPEDGPGLVIIDRNGHRYTSEPTVLAGAGISEEMLRDMCSRVDDGFEPIITKAGEATLIGTHLATEQYNYGYAIMLLKDYCPVAAMANINLIEVILAQMSLVARLTEKVIEKQGRVHTSASAWAVSCLN
jgi:hypothetical protein